MTCRPAASPGGRGCDSRLCDLVELRSDPVGTTVGLYLPPDDDGDGAAHG
jgi:hypothetical protein